MQELLAVEARRESGDFDAAKDALLERLFSRVHHGAFQLISARPGFFGSRWSYHVKYLTADTALLGDMQDGCAPGWRDIKGLGSRPVAAGCWSGGFPSAAGGVTTSST